MIEDYGKYTTEELLHLRDTIVNEYNEYRDVISQAYDGMKASAEKYEEINKELSSR